GGASRSGCLFSIHCCWKCLGMGLENGVRLWPPCRPSWPSSPKSSPGMGSSGRSFFLGGPRGGGPGFCRSARRPPAVACSRPMPGMLGVADAGVVAGSS
ncbi:unnamed protein product, partial [Ixodes persulcatus]